MDHNQVSIPGQRQFGLTTLFVATAFFAVQFAVIRLLGWIAIPVCVHLTATAAILAWTRDRTWRGAHLGFSVGFILAALLLLAAGGGTFPGSLLFLFSLATLGSWIGAARNGSANNEPACGLALFAALIWVMTVMTLGIRILESVD